MKAFTKSVYGGPEVLKLEEVEKPQVQPNQLIVEVKANSPNPADWHILRGEPRFARLMFGLFKPKQKILGADFAGVVVEVGAEVSGFQVGDRVFGENMGGGAFAEYTAVPAHACALMPSEASFAEMACVPIAGVTAQQALVTYGKMQSGESVLVNGASGGVGHFTVQLAKVYGAHVTAVCSSRSANFVKELGADEVIPYDQQDIHQHSGQYDLIVDNHGNLKFQDFKRMGKRAVLVGFTTVGNMVSVSMNNLINKFPLTVFTANANTEDLTQLARLISEEKVRVHIEKTFPYSEIPEAIGYIESMRTKGKVAMVWDTDLI
jgi:NADPH:quinone reductase-like Zn-dependent oxidoreductase